MAHLRQNPAHGKVNAAIVKGTLIRPKNCELCGELDHIYRPTIHKWARHNIIAHHWRGYEYPLDVWWICKSCNRRLHGCHDGTMTRDEARRFIGLRETGSQSCQIAS
jgi:hypothetical protein